MDISFDPQLPTDIGIKSTNYSFEYDPVGDAPQYWGNPLAVLNAIVAFEYVHGYYLDPTSNCADRHAAVRVRRRDLGDRHQQTRRNGNYGDATFVLIPQQGALPLYQPVLDIGKQLGISGLVNPLVALVNPVTKLLVNLGYDRITNPGIARTLSILPFNPFDLQPGRLLGEVRGGDRAGHPGRDRRRRVADPAPRRRSTTRLAAAQRRPADRRARSRPRRSPRSP